MSQHPPRLHDLGWLEYHLPDGSVYYVHPTRRVTTDLNLRIERILFAVDGWMEERKDETLDVSVEGWLREADGKKHVQKKASGGWWGGKNKAEEVIYFERFWVDHHARSVVKDGDEGRKAISYARGHGHGYGGHGKGKKPSSPPQKSTEDRAFNFSLFSSHLSHTSFVELDLEYRFWSFMENHPAHTALPVKAKSEAMDVLNWAWTGTPFFFRRCSVDANLFLQDRLLPSQSSIPPPFTQEECQELMALLRSFNNGKDYESKFLFTIYLFSYRRCSR